MEVKVELILKECWKLHLKLSRIEEKLNREHHWLNQNGGRDESSYSRDDNHGFTHKIKIDVPIFDGMEAEILDESQSLLDETSLHSIEVEEPIIETFGDLSTELIM